VFAIACRSYAIAMALQAQKAKRLYDVKNSNVHQTYTGVHGCKIIKRAVEQTRGVFLAYKQQPIIAMFDCCCGGVVPAHMDDVNFVDAPYLKRTYACHHCKSCSLYAWKCEYEIAHLEDHVSKIHGRIKRLRDFSITKKDKAGLVKQVHVKNGTKKLLLSGQQTYSLLKEVKSFCFKTRRKGNKIIFEGKGYGHHLGLCQWGARQMVRDGYDYKQILQFYYPNTTFMKLP
jgi:stage II sporulation protein D